MTTITRHGMVWLILMMPLTIIAQYERAAELANKIASSVYEDADLPGLATGVLMDGEIVWIKGYGFADVGTASPVDPEESLFRIGSVSKTVTAAALMQLWEAGEIDLDVDVSHYARTFPRKKYTVTLRQIALHVGGIRHYRGDEFSNTKHFSSVTEGLEMFKDDPLIYEPGTQYSYSSYGWNLISSAMETASGMYFLDFIQQRIFDPLSMYHSFPDDVTVDHEGLVTFYTSEKEVAPFVDNSYKWAGGGFLSTAEDLLLFGNGIMTYKVFTENALNEALKTYTLPDGKNTNRGIGFAVGTDKKGRKWYGHSGGSVGGSTMFVIYPDYDLCVVTLVNQSDAGTRDLAFRIAEQFISNQDDR